ncbi:MAG: trypsin-like peptidase domain-containing protein [Candidatus Yonathbacteria bacterium]|nr:trypsin-like peptidase domain-containing protein [Candidatus Yonathbacteria bacterium]
MRKNYSYFLVSLALFAISLVSALTFLGHNNLTLKQLGSVTDVSSDGKSEKLSEEELVSIVKPAVVRIVEHIDVEASVPPFKINFKDFTISTIPGGKSLKMPGTPIDITGSGFVVNPDGYIITNSHVVSDTTVKAAILSPFIEYEIVKATASLSKDEAAKMEKEKTQEDGFAFGQRILDYVIQQSTFNISKKIVVLNPTSDGETSKAITETGFPAEIVSINEDWRKDDKDIAVLKIAEKNLPSLRFGSSEKLSVGQQIYVFGFPSNAELSGNNLLESTFTKGVVSAIKNSPNNDFKIFQTDAKVSKGSSGGPLFDADGEVAGLVTSETSLSGQSNGDNFASVIPAEIAKNIISSNFIINDEGSYGPHLKAGLLLARDKYCKNAITEFNLAKGANQKFAVAKYVDPYIEKCNVLISSGLSIDSKWDEFMVKVRSLGMLAWALFAAGAFLLIVFGIGIAILMKRLKNDQVELDHLEHVIEHQNGSAEAVSPQSPFTTVVKQEKSIRDVLIGKEVNETIGKKDISGTTPLNDPNNVDVNATTLVGDPRLPNKVLLGYIKQARQAGLTFQTIENELKGAGWSDDEISRALAVPQQ